MICKAIDILLLKNNKNRILGVDFGEKNIGLAQCDLTWTIATPLQLLKRTSIAKDIDTLINLIQTNDIACVVFGFPLNMNGTKGPSCERIEKFIEKLLEKMDVPIILWDERLSTTAVTRTLLAADLSRKKRFKVVDRAAAGYILQGVLDHLKLQTS